MIARVLLLYCVLCGAVQTWAYRHAMNADGIAYLDLGDAWMRGDWKSVSNSYWSPTYPILLGIANRMGGADSQLEFVRAHAVNFVLFLGTLAAFTWFLNRFLERTDAKGLYRASLIVAGYSLFIYSALELQANRNVSPDMGLMTVVYLAGGRLLEWGDRKPTLRSGVILGAILGVGFWIKGAMFAVGWIFIAAAAISGGRSRGHIRAGAAAAAAFLAVCAPWIAVISHERGHLTAGDTGRLNYAFLVSGVYMTHWRGDPSLATQPLHPTRMISSSPDAFEFATPIRGTYPPWDDPAYWNEGINPHFNWQKQLQVLKASLAYFWRLFSRPLVGWTVVLAAISILAPRSWAAYWWIILPCVTTAAMYSLVLVEGRYVAPFMTLFLFVVTAGATGKKLHLVSVTAAAATLLQVGVSQVSIARNPWPASSEQVALAVKQAGLKPGDQVAVVEDGLRHYWARLAHARVIAELPSTNQYVAADEPQRRTALEALTAAGARWVISSKQIPDAAPYTWRKLTDTGYFVLSREP
jgi:hypothetical protein